uniref:Uncharacterized protein n=1 Tax=Opuntia streptacantha TaxID=393608 RepID=A0A7C8ZTZ1_OPUST
MIIIGKTLPGLQALKCLLKTCVAGAWRNLLNCSEKLLSFLKALTIPRRQHNVILVLRNMKKQVIYFTENQISKERRSVSTSVGAMDVLLRCMLREVISTNVLKICKACYFSECVHDQ